MYYIQGHGKVTDHKPEVILNNFTTRLGHSVARLLASWFPQVPQFQGRRVVTFHNQRDFIFVRHHRWLQCFTFSFNNTVWMNTCHLLTVLKSSPSNGTSAVLHTHHPCHRNHISSSIPTLLRTLLASPTCYIVGITIMLSDFVMIISFAQVHIPQCSEGGSTGAGASHHSQAAVPSEGDLRLQTWRIHLVTQGQST